MVGFGYSTISRFTDTDKSLCRKWIKKSGLFDATRQKRKKLPGPINHRAQQRRIEELIILEYRKEARILRRHERIWGKYWVDERTIDNKAKVAYQLNRIKTDPIYRCKFYARKRIREYCKRAGMGKKFSASGALGCDGATLKLHLERLFKTGMTWHNHGDLSDCWHIDHVIPLATATTEEQVMKLCHYTNLQPLWKADNLAKGAKLM